MRVLLNDQAGAPLAQLIEQATPERAARIVAPAANNLFRTHLSRLNDERPNRLGGKRTNFFSQVADRTGATAAAGTVTVNIADYRIRQRYEGGTIRPGPGKKFLTIPARTEAYNTKAKDYNFLTPIFFRSGNGALVQADRSNRNTREAQGGGVWFWLVKSVTQRPDPTVLPNRDAVVGASIKALDTWFAGQSRRAAAKAQKGGA
jgi:hypothetical protein